MIKEKPKRLTNISSNDVSLMQVEVIGDVLYLGYIGRDWLLASVSSWEFVSAKSELTVVELLLWWPQHLQFSAPSFVFILLLQVVVLSYTMVWHIESSEEP